MGRRNTYYDHTHRPVNCLAFLLLPLVCFQFGAAYFGTALRAPQDLDRVLKFFGATSAYLPAILIVAILLIQQVSRREKWRIQPKVLAGMFAESIFWVIPLIGISLITGRLLHQAAGTRTEVLIQEILLALGAGIYEEFVFRLLLITIVMLLFVDVLGLPESPVVIAGILASAALFSLYHFTGQPISWPELPWDEFVFRTVAGVYLGGVFYYRGFAIAVGVHSFFNIYVFVAT